MMPMMYVTRPVWTSKILGVYEMASTPSSHFAFAFGMSLVLRSLRRRKSYRGAYCLAYCREASGALKWAVRWDGVLRSDLACRWDDGEAEEEAIRAVRLWP